MPEAKPSFVATLKKVPVFDVLTEEERQLLMRRVIRQHFKVHEVIFREGEPCRGLHLIETGQVKIFRSSAGGREQILATRESGGTLGELALVDGGGYPVSATASTDSDLLLIKAEDLEALFVQHPEVRVSLLELIAASVRPMIGIVEHLCFRTVRQRLAALLLRLATDGKRTAHGVEFTLASSYRDLAAQIGTVPEVVSRNLAYLQAGGFIRVQGKKIIVRDSKALQAKMEG
jgi:CRP/FNR family transcriptional regulator